MPSDSLCLAVIGAFAPHYARHAILLDGLAQAGVQVRRFALPPRTPTPQRWRHLWRSFAAVQGCDAVFLPSFNQTSAPLAGLLASRYRLPLLVDYMVGLSDLGADRQGHAPLRSRVFAHLDRWNIARLHTVTDADAHRREFVRLLGASTERMQVLPVGVRDLDPLPAPDTPRPLVQYAGTYIPFHGVEHIVQAAALLPQVDVELIGTGQHYERSVALAQQLGAHNLRFVKGYFPSEELLAMQARSTIMLGVFGAARKTDYVVPNKVYEALALGRPLITAESSAIREFLSPGEHLLTVPPGDADALAAALQRLLDSPAEQERLRQQGRQRIEEAFLPRHIGARLRAILETLLAG